MIPKAFKSASRPDQSIDLESNKQVSPMETTNTTLFDNERTSFDSKIEYQESQVEGTGESWFTNLKDSFKRMPVDDDDIDPNLSQLEQSALRAAKTPLQRSLKSRHLQMIAIGGAIGTGLFVGSGTALSSGGPASLLIAYGIIGIMIFITVHALGELAVTFPVGGAFLTYNSRFISPTWGFCMAWNYSMQWLIILPLELVAASMTIKYWNTSISPAVWVTIFYLLIVFINLFGVKGYGEAEFVFSMVKVLAVVGFIIVGIVINCGGGPNGGYLGGEYWSNPGAFNSGFKGLCTVFVTAASSFTGTEMVGLAAAETANPRKTLPSATKQVFWRICLFYMVSLTIIGVLVPYNDSRLLSTSSVDVNASPFVIAIVDSGIKVLPSIMNAVILIAVLSVGNSAVFGCSRTIASLADQDFAPKIFGYIDRQGRPLFGVGMSLLFGLLCYLSVSSEQSIIFGWLLALAGLSSIFTWGSICFSHIRFRMALKYQGRSTDELPFTSVCGIYGSYLGVLLNVLVLIAQFWVALWPIDGSPNAKNFFKNYLTVVVLIAFYLIRAVWKRKEWCLYLRLNQIDVDTGRRDTDLVLLREDLAEERAFLASRPFYYRVYKFWC
ncbi:hypothetical protein CANARDRAFT_6825 [[Candida] arabinofermentans NRRL YB-2248]|uniref:Amino acid permease/ SLC12A domain-containing protein n=1 Tax=[Candida] arabinofermentans NRRL YB-2248 TaxID=983967 RepID=A0A1E4T3P5_9ASCO|nr:hypothetical protein CANARDRAFT_6825 [[Candida] arabinofermentans NRRL YB-2248]